MENEYIGLLVFVVAMVTSMVVYPLALKFARNHDIVDNPKNIDVLVDQRAPLENVQRFLKAMKYNVTATELNGEWKISATK